MKICHFSTVHAPFDGRIFHKECRSLAQEGHEVYFVVPHDKDEKIFDVNIVAIPKPDSRFQRIFKTAVAGLKKIIKINPEAVHFHDPELLPYIIILKILGKKIIYDAHEDFAKDILDKDWLGNIHWRKFVSFFADIIEKLAVKFFFNVVIAATPHIGQKFVGRDTYVVRNLPIVNFVKNSGNAPLVSDVPLIAYSGGLTRIRGIKNLILAMQYLSGKAKLLLIGDWEDEEFKSECAALPGYKNVVYGGFIPYGEHFSYIRKCVAGIVNFLPLPNHEDALPNKPFEYMVCGLPVIMSDFKYWREIFKPCAVFINPNDPEDISKIISMILENEKLRKYLSANSLKMISESYSWESEAAVLIKIYNRLSGR